MNLPRTSPRYPHAMAVASNAEAAASNSTVPHATCEPVVLVAPTVPEFNAYLADGIRGIVAKLAWLDVYLVLPKVRPQLN